MSSTHFGVRTKPGAALALLIQNAANIDELARNLVDLFLLHMQGAIVGLSKEHDGALVNYELAADVHPSHRHVVELGFSILLAEIRRHLPGVVTRAHLFPP